MIERVASEDRSRRSGFAEKEGGACVACGSALAGAERCSHCGAANRAGRFQVLRQIAQTPRGRMYLAEGEPGERVALKELVFSTLPGLQQLESFRREARLLAELSDPSIPRFVDSFEAGSGVSTRLYIAQEYVEGRSLAEELESRRFEEAEVKDIAAQVLDVLVRLQARRPPVFHRDLKPANLIRRSDGSIAVVDFGSARDSVLGTLGATVDVGTFGYVPPEQLGGEVDATSDGYALGTTLAHLLTRVPPRELLARRAALGTTDEMSWFLGKLAAPAPADRFADASAALYALRTGRPPLERVRSGRGSVLAVVVGSAAALAIAAGVIVLSSGNDARIEAASSGNDVAPIEATAEVQVRKLSPKTWEQSWLAHEKEWPGDLFSDVILAGATSEAELRELVTSSERSSQGTWALWEIAAAQMATFKEHGAYVVFERATPETWKALGIEAPAAAAWYEFSSSVVDGQFAVHAIGNVDRDEFVERMSINGGRGSGVTQNSHDILNFDYTTGAIHDQPATAVSPLVRELAVVQRRSMTAARALEDIDRAQALWHLAMGAYLEFDELTPELARKLGVTLPSPAYHRFSAKVGAEGKLELEARGDVDGDRAEDLWRLQSGGAPYQDGSDWKHLEPID